jgi:hypothetical protein
MASRKKPAPTADDTVDNTLPAPQETTAPTTDESAMPFDKMVRIYRKISATIAEKTAANDEEIADLEAQKDVLKDAMRAHMKEQNATSINTPFGLAILGKSVRYSTNDWDSFKTFMKEHDALDLVEKRIAQKNMADFRTRFPDLVPVGLSSDSVYTITVRKPTAPKDSK